MKIVDADAFIADARRAGLDTAEKVLFALSHQPTIEPNLILPERMERGECYEVGETIVVLNHDDYYDLLTRDEPKQGEWTVTMERHFLDSRIQTNVKMKAALGKGYHTYLNQKCSNCNKVSMVDASIWYDYCPHCGARMKGADDEHDK